MVVCNFYLCEMFTEASYELSDNVARCETRWRCTVSTARKLKIIANLMALYKLCIL